MREAWEASEEQRDWKAHVRSDLTTYLDVLASEPAFAWALHIEVLAAGTRALERRAEIFALFTQRTRRIHELAGERDPSLPGLPREVFMLHTGGMDELIREHLRTHGAKTLPSIAGPAVAAPRAMLGARS